MRPTTGVKWALQKLGCPNLSTFFTCRAGPMPVPRSLSMCHWHVGCGHPLACSAGPLA